MRAWARLDRHPVGASQVCVADLKWEQCVVTYNLAASFSAQAALPPLSSADAIKLAAKNFSVAAGLLH